MKKILLSLALGALAVPGSLLAATLNVPGTHATIQAAIDAAAASGDEIVVASGTYVGGLLINGKSLTLRGDNALSRPVLALQQVGGTPPAGNNTCGILIVGDNINVTLQDLIVIPSGTSAPLRGIQTTTATANQALDVTFRNILFTPNNGSDGPALTDPYDTTTAIATRWGATPGSNGDILYLTNRAFLGALDSWGNYTIEDCQFIGAGRHAIVAYITGIATTPPPTHGNLTMTGCVVNRPFRDAFQWGNGNNDTGKYTITGTRANPGVVILNQIDGGTTAGLTAGSINGAKEVAIDHMVINGSAEPFWIAVSAANPAEVAISDSLFMNYPGALEKGALYVGGVGVSDGITISDSTFYNVHTGVKVVANTSPISISGNVISGSAAGPGVFVEAGNVVSLTNNGFHNVTAPVEGTLGGSETGTITGNPNFASTTVASAADLTTAFDLSGVGYSASVSGWGTFTAPTTPTSADLWSAYE